MYPHQTQGLEVNYFCYIVIYVKQEGGTLFFFGQQSKISLPPCLCSKNGKLCGHYLIENPGRFAPITCSPRKVSRFAPLNRYYIIIDEVFFNNFLVIIYLLVVYKKIIIHSFWSTLIIYLLVQQLYTFILVYFCRRSKEKLFLQNLTKNQ